ncbi:MAG: hypothetical protein KC589_00195 [Nanoarchaeota archaeon]|nr:hypothetical protein [Nanoarchaeota archaeon]
MNIAYEFSKVKDAFGKVRTDLAFLGDKIGENYDDFMKNHNKLALKVAKLSEDMKSNMDELRAKTLGGGHIDDKELFDIKLAIKDLKEELTQIQKEHHKVVSTIDSVKKEKTPSKEIKNIKEKLHASELEIFLLKERMIEKDLEIKQIKEVNKHMFAIIDDLSKAELDMLNLKR